VAGARQATKVGRFVIRHELRPLHKQGPGREK
jgi:hypothetical protein